MAKAVNETVKNYENCENHENRENLKISLNSSILDISAGIWTLFEKKTITEYLSIIYKIILKHQEKEIN